MVNAASLGQHIAPAFFASIHHNQVDPTSTGAPEGFTTMTQTFLPGGPRSATAASGISDIRDENLYSAVLLQNGGAGPISFFTVPKGQAIPALKGSAAAVTTNAWQLIHGDHTTNFEKAGELGDGIGDAGIRGITLHVEQSAFAQAAGAVPTLTAYGSTNAEIADLSRKTSFELKVSKKPMFKSPFFAFPTVGGVTGALASNGTAASTVINDVTTNGFPGSIRRLVRAIMASRRDTLEGVLTVAGSSVLLFRDATGAGTPCLCWCVLPANIRGDVR
jgi:hypothetical protein